MRIIIYVIGVFTRIIFTMVVRTITIIISFSLLTTTDKYNLISNFYAIVGTIKLKKTFELKVSHNFFKKNNVIILCSYKTQNKLCIFIFYIISIYKILKINYCY